MTMTARSIDSLRGEINITPFIDVLLVLLVIFMVSVKVRQVLLAQLAHEVATGRRATSHPIVLELRDNGTYALNQHVVERRELPGYLSRVYMRRSESILFVKAGPSRRYSELIDAFDVATGAGVQVIAMAP